MSDRLETLRQSPRADISVFTSLAQADVATVPARHALQTLLRGLERVDGLARFVVDRAGRLQAQSPGTADALMYVDSIALADGKLTGRGDKAVAKIAELLSLEDGEIGTVMRKSSRMEGHCIFRGIGLCPRAVLITVQCAHPDCEAELADLTEAFGLTPSEAHVTEMLLGGKSPVEIAAELGVSVNTVRAHLRHCYEKLGVSSREELWRTVSPYRLK